MLRDVEALARRQMERRTIDEGTAIWRNKRKLETLLEAEEKKLQQWKMLATYNPWGKPGHGAPMPGALRKTKWILEDANQEMNPHSKMTLGHGGPPSTVQHQHQHQPPEKLQGFFGSDPLALRFRRYNPAKGTEENDATIECDKSARQDKENYRKVQLDAITERQKKKLNSLKGEGNATATGQKGWTNDSVFQKLERDMWRSNEREQVFEINGGGVELVPLLAKHRMVTKCPLTTTDITKISRLSSQFAKPGSTPPEYFRQLCNQVEEKEKQKLQEQREETVKSNKHFETWQGFWGRPGHGAPKALSQREKLEVILYRMPSKRLVPCTRKQQ